MWRGKGTSLIRKAMFTAAVHSLDGAQARYGLAVCLSHRDGPDVRLVCTGRKAVREKALHDDAFFGRRPRVAPDVRRLRWVSVRTRRAGSPEVRPGCPGASPARTDS